VGCRYASVTLTGCSISHVGASSSSDVNGGVLYLAAMASATLISSTISHAVAMSTAGDAKGGLIYLAEGATATLTGGTISHVAATSMRGRAMGGTIFVSTDAIATLDGVSVTAVTAELVPAHECLHTCVFASDANCDDGGPGAEFAVCACASGSGSNTRLWQQP
jgi:hypothetical protein